jgi:hypothetical protein
VNNMSRTGHAGNSGLQSHSVGELYPWSIVVIDSNGHGVCQGRNLITGEIICNVKYNDFGSSGSFESAHRTAEFLCADRKGSDDYDAAEAAQSAQPAQSAELTVCRLIVPIVRDDNKLPHRNECYDYLHCLFCDVFGGFTIKNVRGAWKDDTGRPVYDDSVEYEAAGSAAAVKILTDRAAFLSDLFGQQCIYLVTGTIARLYYRPQSAA